MNLLEFFFAHRSDSRTLTKITVNLEFYKIHPLLAYIFNCLSVTVTGGKLFYPEKLVKEGKSRAWIRFIFGFHVMAPKNSRSNQNPDKGSNSPTGIWLHLN